MGQKTHPSFLKLSLKDSEWNSKYSYKNCEESSFLLYKDLEIRSYISRILYLYGLILIDCKIEYSVSKLYIFISFYDRLSYIDKKLVNNLSYGLNYKVNRKKLIVDFITNLIVITFSIDKLKFSSINLKLKNLNKRLESKLLFNKKSRFYYKQLLRSVKVKFEFKEIIKVAFIIITEMNSARLLAFIVSLYIKKTQKQKKHYFFFLSIKKIFLVLINSKFSKINGLKVLVNGRFNGFPRSKTRFFSLGSIPLQSFNSNIDYCSDISYTVHGTFGVKVWIFEKLK